MQKLKEPKSFIIKDIKAGDEITVKQPPRWMVLQGLIVPEDKLMEEEE